MLLAVVLTGISALLGVWRIHAHCAARRDVLAAGGAESLPLIQIVSLIMGWLYFTVLESSTWQGTPGKRLLGVRVTDVDGGRIGFAQANGRFFGKILSFLILGMGFVLAAFTDRKQALHDMMASCLVLRTHSDVPPPEVGPPTIPPSPRAADTLERP